MFLVVVRRWFELVPTPKKIERIVSNHPYFRIVTFLYFSTFWGVADDKPFANLSKIGPRQTSDL